jgi:head-tail adaptor
MLRDSREVWRRTETADAMGGRATTWALVGTVRCKVDVPSVSERELADQWQALHSHNVFVMPSADVRRGDELRGGPLVLRVLSVVEPSRPDYRRALCSAEQTRG